MAAGECVGDRVVLASLVNGSEIIPLQLRDPTMVLAVRAAGCRATKKILEGGMVREEVEPVTMEPRAEMFNCPSNR